MIHELDDDAFERAHNQRADMIQQLHAEGFERWDMHPNGDERFAKGDKIVTVKFNPATSQFETDQ